MRLKKRFINLINKLPSVFLLLVMFSTNVVSPIYAMADGALVENKGIQVEKSVDSEIEETQPTLESVSVHGEMSTAGATEMGFWDPLLLLRPSKPVLTSPIGGIVINNNRPLMQWEDSELGVLRLIFGKVKKYNYEYKYDCEGSTPESCKEIYKTTTKISEYQAGDTADGKGFWRVQAVDDWGILEIESDWSDYAEFTVDTIAPTATVEYSPSTLTNQRVDAIVTFNEPIREMPTKESGYDGGTIPNFVKCIAEMTECMFSHWAVNRDYVIAFYDLAGNKGTLGIKVENIDTKAPSKPIITARDGYIAGTWTNKTVTLDFESTDNVTSSENLKYEYTTSPKIHPDSWMPIDNPKEFTGNVYNNVYVRAIDEAGNISEYSEFFQVKVDQTKPKAPQVNTNGYTSGTWTNKDVKLEAFGSEEQNNDGVQVANQSPIKYQFRYNNEDRWQDFNSVWFDTTYNRNLTVTFRAVDEAGNISDNSEIITVLLDKDLPTVEILDVAPYNPESFKVKASDTNGLKRIDYSLWTDNNKTRLGVWGENIDTNSFEKNQDGYREYINDEARDWILLKNLGDGEYTLRATVKDKAGNEVHAKSVYFKVDRTHATFAISSPTNESVVSGKQRINAIITDANDITKVLMSIPGVSGNYVWEKGKSKNSLTRDGDNFYVDFDTETLPDGLIHVTLRATDGAGNTRYWNNNSGNRQHSFIIDNTAPITKITSPINGTYVRGKVDFRGTVTDTNLLRYYYNIKGVASKTVTQDANLDDETIYEWDTTKYADGEYEIRLEARDKADNKDSKSIDVIKVYVDNTAPVIEITSPIDGSTRKTGDGKLEITGSISDNVKANYIEIQIVDAGGNGRGGVITVHGAKTDELLTTLDISALEDGTYRIYYHGADHIGNVSEKKFITITINNSQPESSTPQTPIDESEEVAGITDTNTPKTPTTPRTGRNATPLIANAIETTDEETEIEEKEEDEKEVLGEEDEKVCKADKKISGHIYIDKNNNNEQNDGEKGIKDVKVQIYVMENGQKKIIKTITTDEEGYFETTTICAGKYNILVEEETLPKGYTVKGEAEREIVVTEEDTDASEGAYLGVSIEDTRSFIQKYWYWILILIPIVGYIIYKKKNEDK